jgi:hypothetical protein
VRIFHASSGLFWTMYKAGPKSFNFSESLALLVKATAVHFETRGDSFAEDGVIEEISS